MAISSAASSVMSNASLLGTGGQNAVSANALAADARNLNSLKAQAGQDSPKAIRETAKQLESLFMRELLKSMREATMKSGLTDNAGTDLGTDMLDQQFAVQMSGQRGGLSDLIAKQLSRQTNGADADGDAAPMEFKVPSTLSLGRFDASGITGAAGAGAASTVAPANRVRTAQTQAGFVEQHADVAARVGQDSGIPAAFMVGQAGHETGWGRSEIRMKDGSNSYNLFGIKAGGGWTGKVAEITTTEYVGGKAQKVTAKFRAYDSYEDSFRDYARMINESPRYAAARGKTDSALGYATELKRAGYATDPAYASKLSRAIKSTEQLQRAQQAQATVPTPATGTGTGTATVFAGNAA
ncbi:flagellar assembly peptidoglycan hydrolase FlgJ [Sphingomonas sp. NCPPB 2930]